MLQIAKAARRLQRIAEIVNTVQRWLFTRGMILSNTDLNQLLTAATTAAQKAGTHIQEESGKHREVLRKDGGDTLASQVVTEVDFESQRLILDTLSDSRAAFELGLLTEERQDDASRLDCDYFWCIDPLDGTLPFVENVAGYSVSIALVSRNGIPEIGVIFDPVTETLYHAVRGGGAYRNGEPFEIIANTEKGILTLVSDRSFAKQARHDQLVKRMGEVAAENGMCEITTINQGGAAMNACWVLEKAPAVYFKFPKPETGGGSLWDYSASACLFQELGAVVSDIHGEPLNLNRVDGTFMHKEGIVYASNQALGEAVRALYREFQQSP